MDDISRKIFETNGVEIFVDNDGILQLNEKHIEEGLDHKNLSGHRKHRYDLVDEPKKQPSRIFIHKELATKVIMDFRTTAVHKFKTKLGFEHYYIILTKEQSVLTKIKSSFERENRQTQ